MGAWEQECAGPEDGVPCPDGETNQSGVQVPVYLCPDCADRRGLDALLPDRWPAPDDGLTRPTGDPHEAGHDTAA